MTKTTFLAAVQAAMTLLGSFLIGHTFFHHQVDNNLWQLVGGSILTIAGAAWGIYDNHAAIEAWQSGIRSIIQAVSGVLLALGMANQQTIDQVLALSLTLIPLIQTLTSHAKVKQMAAGQLEPHADPKTGQPTGKVSPTTPKVMSSVNRMPMIAFLILMACLCHGRAHAQGHSLFAPLHKPAGAAQVNRLNRATIVTAAGDTIYTGFRFGAPSVLATLPDFTIYTGICLSYEHDTFHHTTGKWYTDWAIMAGGYEGGQFAPNNLQAVTGIGLSASFFNKLLTIGVLYNLTTQKIQGGIGPTVSLNN